MPRPKPTAGNISSIPGSHRNVRESYQVFDAVEAADDHESPKDAGNINDRTNNYYHQYSLVPTSIAEDYRDEAIQDPSDMSDLNFSESDSNSVYSPSRLVRRVRVGTDPERNHGRVVQHQMQPRPVSPSRFQFAAPNSRSSNESKKLKKSTSRSRKANSSPSRGYDSDRSLSDATLPRRQYANVTLARIDDTEKAFNRNLNGRKSTETSYSRKNDVQVEMAHAQRKEAEMEYARRKEADITHARKKEGEIAYAGKKEVEISHARKIEAEIAYNRNNGTEPTYAKHMDNELSFTRNDYTHVPPSPSITSLSDSGSNYENYVEYTPDILREDLYRRVSNIIEDNISRSWSAGIEDTAESLVQRIASHNKEQLPSETQKLINKVAHNEVSLNADQLEDKFADEVGQRVRVTRDMIQEVTDSIVEGYWKALLEIHIKDEIEDYIGCLCGKLGGSASSSKKPSTNRLAREYQEETQHPSDRFRR